MNNTNDKVVKEALSYVLGSDLHESWRETRKREDSTFEPRLKKSKDKKWNEEHGTDVVDIANCSFEELPSNLKYENIEAARVAIELVYDNVISGKSITPEELEKMGARIHEEWLKRNSWVYDKEYGDAKLAVSYEQLSKEEQEKDKLQIQLAKNKIEAYIKGIIHI